MTDTKRQRFILSLILFLHTITLSSAKHHHHGQKCSTAWSSTQAHFSLNPTAPTAINPNATQNATVNSNATQNATASPGNKNLQQFNVSGIRWQYEGEPIKSTADSQAQVITVTPPINQTIPPGQGIPKPGDQLGLPCLSAGVLLSCSKCEKFLFGKDCYKKIGPEQLDIVSSGKVKCDLWYTRTGYGEGGGVTMCGSKSGDVYQCSSDKGLTECEPCVELGTTSTS